MPVLLVSAAVSIVGANDLMLRRCCAVGWTTAVGALSVPSDDVHAEIQAVVG